MPVQTRANLTDNLWKVGEIWIPRKEIINGNKKRVSGFGVSMYNVEVIENKDENKYQVLFHTLGKNKAIMGECTYQDAYNENIKADQVPFIFGIYDENYDLNKEMTQEVFDRLPGDLKELTNQYNKVYLKSQSKLEKEEHSR